mmetsp:Transcript_17933/g.34695  ORF Transcript_17933/g.34695 Transcript_17933/m.34695 type:complete len:301 (+) Transcript_17933:371-1273(+)
MAQELRVEHVRKSVLHAATFNMVHPRSETSVAHLRNCYLPTLFGTNKWCIEHPKRRLLANHLLETLRLSLIEPNHDIVPINVLCMILFAQAPAVSHHCAGRHGELAQHWVVFKQIAFHCAVWFLIHGVVEAYGPLDLPRQGGQQGLSLRQCGVQGIVVCRALELVPGAPVHDLRASARYAAPCARKGLAHAVAREQQRGAVELPQKSHVFLRQRRLRLKNGWTDHAGLQGLQMQQLLRLGQGRRRLHCVGIVHAVACGLLRVLARVRTFLFLCTRRCFVWDSYRSASFRNFVFNSNRNGF